MVTELLPLLLLPLLLLMLAAAAAAVAAAAGCLVNSVRRFHQEGRKSGQAFETGVMRVRSGV